MKYSKAKKVVIKSFKDQGMKVEFGLWFSFFGRLVVKRWAQEALDEQQKENQMQEE